MMTAFALIAACVMLALAVYLDKYVYRHITPELATVSADWVTSAPPGVLTVNRWEPVVTEHQDGSVSYGHRRVTRSFVVTSDGNWFELLPDGSVVALRQQQPERINWLQEGF